jgi:hypothetical protein
MRRRNQSKEKCRERSPVSENKVFPFTRKFPDGHERRFIGRGASEDLLHQEPQRAPANANIRGHEIYAGTDYSYADRKERKWRQHWRHTQMLIREQPEQTYCNSDSTTVGVE